MLISVGMSPEQPLMMEDVGIIQKFFESLDNEKIELMWGIKNNKVGTLMSLVTVCMNKSL